MLRFWLMQPLRWIWLLLLILLAIPGYLIFNALGGAYIAYKLLMLAAITVIAAKHAF